MTHRPAALSQEARVPDRNRNRNPHATSWQGYACAASPPSLSDLPAYAPIGASGSPGAVPEGTACVWRSIS